MQVLACPTRTSSSSTPIANPPAQLAGAGGVFTGRRHDPLQHGRQPGEREGLRLQHRGAQRRALRGPRHLRRRTAVRGHLAREPDHRARARRRRRRRGTSTSTSTTTPAARRSRTPRTTSSLALPARAWRSSSDGATLYVAALRLEQGRRLRHGAARERHLRARAPATRSRVSGGGPTGLVLDEARSALYVLTRFDNAISIVDTGDAARRSAHVADVQPRAGRASSTGRRFLYDASLHLEPRRLGLRELPHLRRLRQPGLGPRQPGRRRCSRNPGPFDAVPLGRSGSPRLPPDEGADDHAEPARHGEPRPDALARRPHRRQRRAERAAGQRHLRRGRGVQEVQRRRSPACSAATRQLTHERHAGVHRLHPAGHLSAEPDPQPRQLAHAEPAGRARLLLQRPISDIARRHLQRLPRARSATANAEFGVASAGLLRHRRPLRRSRPSRRSSRSRTCATCTRRSACSAWPHVRPADRPPASPVTFLPAPFNDNGFLGDQVRGFGFLHDGSVDTLFRFLSATSSPSGRATHPSRTPAAFTRDDAGHRAAPRSSRRSCSRSTATSRRSSASRSR